METKLRHGNRVQVKRSVFAAAVCDRFGLGTVEANWNGPALKGEVFVRWDNGSTSWALATWLEGAK
jgi:hypothetical protein